MTLPALPPSSLARTRRGNGPGLLLAHGAGGGIEPNFGPLIGQLANHHTVVAPDLPGTGDTPRAPAPLTVDGLADALVSTAVEEGVETFAVSAYSMGVPLAIRAATRHPERVTRLVLTAGFAHPNPRLRLAVRLWRELLGAADRAPLAAYASLIGVGAPHLDRVGRDDLDAALKEAAASVPPGTSDHLDLIDLVDVRSDLPHVRVPTLVVSTVHDTLVTPFHHRQVADGIPSARFEEIATGHLPFAEAPQEWLTLMAGFLAAR